MNYVERGRDCDFGYDLVGEYIRVPLSAVQNAPTTVSDWLKAFGGYSPPPAPVEPPKPEDPRSETLRRAIAADRPLDGYGRRV